LQLNPAFAGNTKAPFVTINYRNQWAGFADLNTYVTYAASFSQYIEGLNSGIGLMVEADDAGDGIYQTTFGDQIDVSGEIDLVSDEIQPDNATVAYGDIGTGFLVYNELFYGGLTVKHLNRPDESILGINNNVIDSGLPVRFSIHGGAQIDLGGNKRGRSSFISPNFLLWLWFIFCRWMV